MAHDQRAGTNGQRTNGVYQGDHDVPPSTMAAQLINNISTGNNPSRTSERDDLQRLMAEISQIESQGTETGNIELQTQNAHKLIYVFTRAVLERLSQDDPFVNVTEMVAHASDALDVFATVIKETPGVLVLIPSENDQLQGRGIEQLWLWLFPRLLPLLGRPKMQALSDKIKSLLLRAFEVVAVSPQLWCLSASMFVYLRDCVFSILEHCSAVKVFVETAFVDLNIPPANNGYAALDTAHAYSLDQINNSTYHVSSLSYALCHGEQLLRLIGELLTLAAATQDSTYAFRDYSAWFLDSVSALSSLQKRRQVTPQRKSEEGVDLSLLMTIDMLVKSSPVVIMPALALKANIVQAILLNAVLTTPPELQSGAHHNVVAHTILRLSGVCQNSASSRRLILSYLDILPEVLASESFQAICSADLKKTLHHFSKVSQLALRPISSEAVAQPFNDNSLEQSFQELKFNGSDLNPDSAISERPQKRRKLAKSEECLDKVVLEINLTLGCEATNHLDGLKSTIEATFASLDEVSRVKVIKLISLLPCALNGHLVMQGVYKASIMDATCFTCDDSGHTRQALIVPEIDLASVEEAILILETLTEIPQFKESPRLRTKGMLALRRFIEHIRTSRLLDIEISPLGQWCVRSLRSSVRELRISASRTIGRICLHDSETRDTRDKNRYTVMDILRSIRQEGNSSLQEACILTWGQMGRTMDDRAFVFVLLELVEYLGHANPIISGIAYSEILAIADARDVSIEQLFEPYWDVVALCTVKDLITKPQTTQHMAELFNISVEDFLLLTQAHSLPYLVLNQNFDIIKRISQARGDQWPWQQSTNDHETYIMGLLSAYDDKFKNNDLVDIIKIEPATTAFYLLMAAGEADPSVKSRVRYGLGVLATNAPVTEGSQAKKNKVGAFLEQHILGLANLLIDVIMATRVPFSFVERERAIKGVEELVKVAKVHSRIARPHLCSCLQSAMIVPRFQQSAFSAWDAMLRNYEDDDVEAMLESTFSIIIQHWEALDRETRTLCRDTIRYLLKHRVRLIRMSIVNLPSLAHLESLEDVDDDIEQFRRPTDTSNALQIFSRRLRNENAGVVQQALTELKSYLFKHQSFVHASAISDQPDPVIALLIRATLDTCIKFNRTQTEIPTLSAECIGLIGCLDPNRVETVREQRDMVVVTNFKESGETTDFVLFTLQHVLVPVFLSTTDTASQGFFSYSMQSLLEVCDFKTVCGPTVKSGQRNASDPLYQRWQALPSDVRNTLTPFLTSKYKVKDLQRPPVEYPIFRAITDGTRSNAPKDRLYGAWLRTFAADLLHKPSTIHAQIIFPALSRAIRIRDTTVAHFLLPYLMLHVILEGSDKNREQIGEELLSVLMYRIPVNSRMIRRDEWKSCLECVFRVLDYLSRWVQERQSRSNQSRGHNWADEVALVKSIIDRIPAEILSQGALECKSYSRALFYWEQHIRNERSREIDQEEDTILLERMQDIYSQIDEPDGIEGISAQLHVLDIEQQIIGHQKAGRWTAAQTWYEIKLAEKPDDVDIQVNLLNCLKESGQHDVLLNYVEGMQTSSSSISKLLPFATEASWATNRWTALEKYNSLVNDESRDDFNVRLGQALLALHHGQGETGKFCSIIGAIRTDIARSLSAPTTASIAVSHDVLLKLHVLTEIELVAGVGNRGNIDRGEILSLLNRRINVLGSYFNDKQYLLGIRRAVMKLSKLGFEKEDIAEAWLTSARLARKGNAMHQSFNAVLHASQLGDSSATIEHARIIWKEGNHRKAIGILEGAIKSNAFVQHNKSFQSTTFTTDAEQSGEQNLNRARAFLLLAKWQDAAGQTSSATLRNQYQEAAKTHVNWEKGHYYLGRHYNKLLESERLLPSDQQKEPFLMGENARLVVENYLRSLPFGSKYLYQTLPRLITLWLELGSQINQPLEAKFGHSKDFVVKVNTARKQNLDALHSRFTKYIGRIPAFMFYTAMPQILSRIAHPNPEVSRILTIMIMKVITTYPRQTLWNLLAVCTSNQADRKNRGMLILQTLQKKSEKRSEGDVDIKTIVRQGLKLTGELIPACDAGEFPNNRTTFGSLSKDLRFNSKNCTPSPLVVPCERMLTVSLPTSTDNMKIHKAFSNEIVVIDSFEDRVMILSSLQKPRKLTAIGSDGRQYGLMCKPKDDLRKDQRLMEFNSMINRALKRDAESSRRQLYIKTYAVTPLNEECGLIEWVDGLKTLRDILLALLKTMGISPQYKEIEYWCEQALMPDKANKQVDVFQKKVLDQYPPVFHKWFVQQFPEPSAWFAARIRYTRSCAVMSMVGTILGLGDRHGENILFEEGNGGTFHVDFNCLFDKGKTFAKPEQVPFRLTHNMVDAMGMYNYEGPFRKSAELTLKLLRQHEETLMTIMEAFVYDPTLDLLNKKPEKKRKEGVPQSGPEVMTSIQRKVKGYLTGETVPLGVEGQVEELIVMATRHDFLAGMYIGWCSFL